MFSHNQAMIKYIQSVYDNITSIQKLFVLVRQSFRKIDKFRYNTALFRTNTHYFATLRYYRYESFTVGGTHYERKVTATKNWRL